MDEREQILYMQVRLMQMAAERWQLSLAQVSALFRQDGLAQYIEENFDLCHQEGDETVFADLTLIRQQAEQGSRD